MSYPTSLLEIFRDTVKPGGEAEYRSIEEDAARICATLAYPHPHVALESLGEPVEVWWLNGFESTEHLQQVTEAYRALPSLVDALAEISRRRESVTAPPIDMITTCRADLSGGQTLHLAGARYLAAAIGARTSRAAVAVYEAPDGSHFSLKTTHTLEEAEAVAQELGAGARVLAVRPYWGMPAAEWIAADPTFWQSSPTSIARKAR